MSEGQNISSIISANHPQLIRHCGHLRFNLGSTRWLRAVDCCFRSYQWFRQIPAKRQRIFVEPRDLTEYIFI